MDIKSYAIQVDENCTDQIETLSTHYAFEGSRIRIMPDAHAGAGAVIGFTAQLTDKIVPNVIGVDIGCGLTGVKMDVRADVVEDEEKLAAIEEKIREAVPTGWHTHDGDHFHMQDDFDWEGVAGNIRAFSEQTDEFDTISPDFVDNETGIEYLKDLCDRVGYSIGDVIQSIGSLGGGNHFIEVGVSDDETPDNGTDTAYIWVIIHSGSRGPGMAVAEYWQDRASQYRSADHVREHMDDELFEYVKFDKDDSDKDIIEWFEGGKGENYLAVEKIREDFDGVEIEDTIERIKDANPRNADRNEALDPLIGEEAHGYIKDMMFAQEYARQSRRIMCDLAVDALLEEVDGVEVERVNSTHNFIDFEDGIIRKGATPAREGQKLIIPFNMRDGTLICKGKGNEEWNSSAPHGAGRIMSRTRAFDELDLKEFKEQMSGIVTETANGDTLDEAPGAYKDADKIEDAIAPTVDVLERVRPIINIKDDS